MWDYSPPPKPFYRRAWFLTILCIFLFIGLGVGFYGLKIKSEYEGRARQFDLKALMEMESASLIYDRNEKLLGRIFIQNRDTVTLADLPREMSLATIAAEDARFKSHGGVDYYGIVRAMVKNWQAGRIREGASTLTQQLARNTFELREKSYERKLVEIFLAREIERNYSKDQIMELYLNRVYFGSGFYGVEAAARGYFGKPAKELTLSECATLTGLLRSPNNLSPWSNRRACIDQRNFVLGRMLELGMIEQVTYEQTVAQDLIVKNPRSLHAESYALDLIRQQVIAQVGKDHAISDGYRIYTTIDSELQKKAEEAMEQRLKEVERHDGYQYQTYVEYDTRYRGRKGAEEAPNPSYLQGAAVVLDNKDGGILTLIGGRNFRQSQFNRAISAARPPGTAFKPLVYAAAFEKGVFPGALYEDSVMDNRQVMIGGTTGILGEWGPERINNRYEGPIPARQALVKSKNAATVRLGNEVGITNVIDLAKRAGISTPMRRYPATFLGSSEVSLMDLTLAYTMFPDGGERPSAAYIIQRIEEKNGTPVFKYKPSKKRVIRSSTAYEIHSCLSEVLESGTGDKAYSQYGLKKFPLGGKTGTAYGFTDTWFVGYSSAVTCGVWVGFDKPRSIYRGAFSNEVALPFWVDVMNSSFSKYIPKEISQPTGLKRAEICYNSGLVAVDKCFEELKIEGSDKTNRHRTTYFEWAREDQIPKDTCDVHGDQVRSYVQKIEKGEWPRAALAVDVASLQPVQIKAPTLLGEDPYQAVQAIDPNLTNRPANVPVIDTQNVEAYVEDPDEKIEIRKAMPVRPLDQPSKVDSTIKIEPPPPMEF